MTPLCTHCGTRLVYWRALDRVPFEKGAVKDQRLYGCTACHRVYRVTWTLWRTGAIEHLPSDREWRRLELVAPGDHQEPPTLAERFAEAVTTLGPVVDIDRLRIAQLIAGWWNVTDDYRNAQTAVANLPGLNWRTAGRGIDDATALGLIDIEDRPATKKPPSEPGYEKTRPGAYRCDQCGATKGTARGLGSHMLTHQPATCDLCDWSGTAAELRAHIKTHRTLDCACGWTGPAAEIGLHRRWHCPNRTEAS